MKNTITNISKKRFRLSKKYIAVFTSIGVMSALMMNTVYAAGEVNASAFITSACTVLKSVIILIGAGLGLWGIVNLLEGYSGDNSAAKSQGMKQMMAGLGLILLAIVLVPVLQNMMTAAAV